MNVGDAREDKLRELMLTDPRFYQWDELVAHCDDETRFLFWVQGVGKTKPVIDNASWLFAENRIDAMLVLAPNGVHYNWLDHELPKHCKVPYKSHGFDNQRDTSGSKKHARALAELLEHDPERLSILTVSYPALLKKSMVSVETKGPRRGEASGFLIDFVRSRRTLIVGDELGMLKNPEGKMALAAQAVSRRAKYRRGLDGTPVDNGPFDLYAIMLFGHPTFWEQHGIGSYRSFQNRYAEFETLSHVTLYKTDGEGKRVARQRWNPETKKREDAKAQKLKCYRNLDDLRRIIETVSSRLTKETALLGLPPKSYVYQPFELTPKQRHEYDTMRKERMVEIEGNLITAQMAFTVLLRLQQITSGYLPTDRTGEQFVEIDPGHDPRLDALVDLADTQTSQGLMWAAFRPERDKIISVLNGRKGKEDTVLCYRSDDSDHQKRETIERWRRGEAQYLLGHVASGLARGHTLVEGDHGIYYSNVYRHAPYCQSEDRIHRIGQTLPVTYYHLAARRTVDQHVAKSLWGKVAVAAETLGDDQTALRDLLVDLKEWLS